MNESPFQTLVVLDPATEEPMPAAGLKATNGSQEFTGPTEDWPEILDAIELINNPPPLPQVLIEGILHKGEKMLLGGAAKIGKTWLALDLAVSVASGTPWLGYPTQKGRVLFINFELAPWAFRKRLEWVCMVKGITLNPDEMLVWNLRGYDVEMDKLVDRLLKNLPNDLALIIPDPVYKTLGDRDENAAGDIADLLRKIELVTRVTGAAVTLTHHFSKGLASAKQEIDRFSGSGVWVRDPDVLVSIQPHEEKGCLVMETTVRNLKSPDPRALRWDFPILVPDIGLDAARVKGFYQPKRDKRQVPEAKQVIDIFPSGFDEKSPKKSLLTSGQIKNLFVKNNWVKDSYKGVLDTARDEGLIRTIKGQRNNEQLHGLPDIVAAYEHAMANPTLPFMAGNKKGGIPKNKRGGRSRKKTKIVRKNG
jgi:hypothetical protein